MSHSSIERITFEDSAQLTFFGLKRLNKVLIELNVDRDKMKDNLSKYNVDSHRKLCESIKNNEVNSRKDLHTKISKGL
jgi:adenylosuccinate lyase